MNSETENSQHPDQETNIITPGRPSCLISVTIGYKGRAFRAWTQNLLLPVTCYQVMYTAALLRLIHGQKHWLSSQSSLLLFTSDTILLTMSIPLLRSFWSPAYWLWFGPFIFPALAGLIPCSSPGLDVVCISVILFFKLLHGPQALQDGTLHWILVTGFLQHGSGWSGREFGQHVF